MFQLLQPIWLFALAGLSIPVIIHLWNQRPGKTLRVGSITLVTENAVSHKKSIKLSEILLLLLRCLLLACIAVALAAPFWKNPANKYSKGWVLMSRPQLAAVYNHFKPLVDSLLQAGMEFHYFEAGFPKHDIANVTKAAPDTTVALSSYRSTVALLNEQTDAKLPLYIFTDNYLEHFAGKRSAVSLNLHWFSYAPDTLGAKQVTDTTSLHITIFSHAYTNDARYLKAAVDAIQQFSNKNIVVKSVTAVAAVPAHQDWLCWLADEPVPADKQAANVLVYAKGKAVAGNSYILPGTGFSFDAIPLYSSITEKDSTKEFAAVNWEDGFGHPLLAVEKTNSKNYYWLYTHIDPAWNEFPWSNSFPPLLYQLLYADSYHNALSGSAHRAIIDSSQLMPVLLTGKEAGSKPILFEETKLAGIFWLAAWLLFFGERCLSFYHRKMMTNG